MPPIEPHVTPSPWSELCDVRSGLKPVMGKDAGVVPHEPLEHINGSINKKVDRDCVPIQNQRRLEQHAERWHSKNPKLPWTEAWLETRAHTNPNPNPNWRPG